jgi:hypothetical protein
VEFVALHFTSLHYAKFKLILMVRVKWSTLNIIVILGLQWSLTQCCFLCVIFLDTTLQPLG